MAPIDSHAAFGRRNVIGPSHSTNGAALAGEVRQWLEAFSAAVRNCDYEAGRRLFAPDVRSFGTRASVVDGLDELVDRQWQPTWSCTRGYRFDFDRLAFGGQGDLAWVAVPWESQGKRADGSWFDRRGRATFVLQRHAGGWRAVHSHHSLEPQ